ncbi:MAG: nuclear transport factor 2 family protein [Thermomicrobiales bacterium]|jgi:ketosteroid isomerase-like protein|nr:MAG: nuclear transport factor 2 family protein [Thermomicrobiales bacterium]
MSASEHPNATIYRRTASALRAGDLATLATFLDPDVIWHIPGDHPMAGDVIGREAVIAFLGVLKGYGFWLTEHDVLANDAHVCALSQMGIRRPTVDIETRVVSIFHYRDGRQAERWFFPDDTAIWDRFFHAGDIGD